MSEKQQVPESTSSGSMASFAPSVSHLQLLLQQHHALQRQEQEMKEQRLRDQQSSTSSTSSSSTPTPSASSTSLKADAQSVAAYMAAYMRLAPSLGASSDPMLLPPTVSPSSTLLCPTPPSTASATPPLSPKKAKSKAHLPPPQSQHYQNQTRAETTGETKRSAGATHEKANKTHRQECFNCGVTKTPLWRRTADRKHSLCNACGLYYKQYQANRPLVTRPKDELSSTSTSTSISTSTSTSVSVADEGSNSSVSATTTEQSTKRRKVEGGPLVKTEDRPLYHMKPLLPHPPRPHLAFSHARSHSYSHPPAQLNAPHLDHAQSEGEMEEDDEEDDSDDDYVDGERDVEMESHTPPSTEEEEEEEEEDDNEDSEDSEDDVQEPFLITQPSEGPDRDQPQLKKQRRRATSQEAAIVCANCGQTQTPLWRKDSQGRPICNACGLYSRLHQRDRPITMRKAKIARRKRDWTQDKEKGSEKNNKAAKKRKEKTESESPASAPSMNIPANTEHDSGDEAMPTPVSSASMSPNLSGMPSMPQGPLSPSLTASPPTPVLSPPNMLFNPASSFPGLNPLLLQQYQQHLQTQSAMNMFQQSLLQQQPGMSVGPGTPGEAILGNNWLSQLYPAYPPASVPFLASSASLNDAGVELRKQQQQQQQQQQSKPFQSKPVLAPLSTANLTNLTPPMLTPRPSLPQIQTQGNWQHNRPLQHSQQPPSHTQQQKKPQGPLILDSTRFTRLMNQMSKPQLSMFLTILEERCGALRHRLSGEDDDVGRMDTNEMMMMLNNPNFSMMESHHPVESSTSSVSAPSVASPSHGHLQEEGAFESGACELDHHVNSTDYML
ncbi:putative electron transfer flavoprotein subunit [Podila clonocystis]|nr:putative electron transfer flavoprotein subunit [Podila clonocystis]